MINKFRNIINKKFSFLKESKLLVTVSGGIDSVILTYLLHKIGINISIAHCNFCLRGKDSDKDVRFVENLASTLNIPFYVKVFDTTKFASEHKLSIQEAARNLRYEWFENIRRQHNLDYILTAHNLNDSLETFLINLSRGTGINGLTGIPIIQNKIIRPLSSLTRDEIYSFATTNNIEWREDVSNANTKYTRNKIRHQVIPVLQELNPNLLNSFKQTLENLQGSVSIIDDRLHDILDVKQDKSAQRQFSIEQLGNKIKTNPKAYLHKLFSPFGFTNTKDILNLLTAQSGKQIFSKTHRLLKDRENLILVKKNNVETRDKRQEIRSTDTLVNMQNFTLSFKKKTNNLINQDLKCIEIDSSKLIYPLIVRKWINGDYFYPIGMQGKKKLSKYFKDAKLSLIEKENIWLLLSDNNIVWVIGMRQDKRFKVTNNTTDVVKITIL